MKNTMGTEADKAYRRTLKDTLTLTERIQENTRLHEKIQFLHQMFRYNYDIGLMEYAIRNRQITHTNIDPEIYNLLFSVKNFQTQSVRRLFDSRGPLFVANDLGLILILVSHFDEQGLIQYYCALGPIFTSINAKTNAPSHLSFLPLSVKERISCKNAISALPVVPLQTLVEYAIMLHGCMNNEKITPGDIHYNYTADKIYPKEETATDSNLHKRQMTDYAISIQKLSAAIRLGDTDYIEKNGPSLFTNLKPLNHYHMEHLRFVQDFCLMLTNTCCNAAICGGLPVLEAYDILGNYLSHFEQKKKEADLYQLLHVMEMDYAARVKKTRFQKGHGIIDECLYYIDSHLSKDLKLETLAEKFGYSPNHLGKLFCETVGMSFRQYITSRKIALAKELLAIGGITIHEVSERCHFSSVSYFSKVFTKETGMTPQEYAHGRQHASSTTPPTFKCPTEA